MFTADGKSAVNQSQDCINFCESECNVFVTATLCVGELSKHRSAPVSVACSVLYCAGFYLQVQGRLH